MSIDLGQRFGRLTVIKNLGVQTRGTRTRTCYRCECECGNVIETLQDYLKSGKVKSCGCLKKDMAAAALKDMTGQKFGLWTVIKRSPIKSRDGAYWICKCECGTVRDVKGGWLRSGRSSSCGCNKIIHDDLTGQKVGRLTPLEYLPDKKDQKDNKYAWRCACDCGNEFVATTSELIHNRIQSCGCLGKEKAREHICEVSKKSFVEGTHIGNITKRGLRVDSKTGVRGVTKRDGRFRAKIGFKNRQYHLGTYDTLEEATHARKKAEELFYDTFLEQYNNKK